MSLEKMYEDRFGEFPLQNITWLLIAGQVFAYITITFYPWVYGAMQLQGTLLLHGQWWRLLSFLFIPIDLSPVWAVLSWYMMYMFGTALEQTWGAFRYFLFLLVAYLATMIGVILFPATVFSNGYVFGSLFLAFAYLNPNFTVYLFFIIPIKVKWLAYLSWFGILLTLIGGSMTARVQTLLVIANFLLFFGRDIILHAMSRAKHGTYVAKHIGEERKTYMKCVVCGATENDDKIFYNCHDCHPEKQYCEDHIHSHKHTVIH